MDLKQIEKLMSAMEKMQIKRVAIKREGFEIEIEKETGAEHFLPPSISSAASHLPPPYQHEFKHLQQQESSTGYEKEVSSDLFINSPMVGTFYSSPSPDDPPFLKVGESVDENSVVCIIEAMKVMNEVKAGVKGTIVQILVSNGEPVEFGTPIFKVKPL